MSRFSIFCVVILAIGLGDYPLCAAEDASTTRTPTAGEIRLIDGDSLAGWMTVEGEAVPDSWEVTDGTLRLNGRGGHIVTVDEYENFDLRFEWKISEGGNSGIKYRVRHYGKKVLGCEYQLLDDAKHKVGGTAKKAAGSLYELYEPAEDKLLKPVGEFNTSRVVVLGNHIEHWLNGQKILEAEVGNDDWHERVALSKFSDEKEFGENRRGRLMLQDHGGEVWFRNIVLKPLSGDLPAIAAREVTPIDFARDIRPILSDACLHCHGPDEANRDSALRLDSRDGAFADLGGYHAFVPGKPDDSEALRRILSKDSDERMPPPDSGKSLTDEQIQLLRHWIEQGAGWERHWAFVAPQLPDTPTVENKSLVHNPIDAFVQSRLEQEGLSPSAEADRVTLLRRLSLDLIGLPPTLDEIDTFLADDSATAYEKVVDRLLKSPHYGERWGRHWLDAARYADSDGFEKDKPREVWFYRDWVINALNRNLPYDQFIVEQIAGDLLPNATQDQIVATGFLRNSMINEEGGIDPEQFRMEAMYDRMDAIGKGILGLTIQCGQCHSHKYDPLTQQDYYRMFAYVNNSHEANMTVYTPEQNEIRRDVFRQIRQVENELQQSHPDWKKRLDRWEESLQAKREPKWTPLRLNFDPKTIGGQKFLLQEDGSYLAAGYAPTRFNPQATTKTKLTKITGIRLELLPDPNLPHGGPGRSPTGTCALTDLEVQARPAGGTVKFAKFKFASASANVSPAETELAARFYDKTERRRVTGPIEFAIDGKAETAWGIDIGPGRRNQAREAVFRFAQPIEFSEGAVLNITLSQQHGGWNSNDNQTNNLGRIRVSVTSSPDPEANPLPQRIRKILSIAKPKRTERQARALFSYWRTTVDKWSDANAQIESIWQQHPEPASQLVLMERDETRNTFRLERGDFLKPQEEVTPGVPSFLHAIEEQSGTPSRLSFARWLVDRDSPTTARAIVNRAWQSYFGIGLVGTSEDLGLQSEAPSHPKLLDWLSVQFMESGWDLKALHRLIVKSATYRQSSVVTPDLYARDPYNRLLARGPRFRVDAEVVRDIALAASGLLNRKIGGRSVYPPAPEFLFLPPASYGTKTWKYETGPEKYRRGLYTFQFRSVPFPVLQSFDAPNGDSSCVRRSRSNTPLQALTTLNEPLFMESARALGLRAVQTASTDAERLQYIYRRCIARMPTSDEADVLLALLDDTRTKFAMASETTTESADESESTPNAAMQLAAANLAQLPPGVSVEQLAAWTVVARVVLNLDETITKE